jgi:hypothetical protein
VVKIFDYIVVGSGCAGSMVAQTLVEAGAKVVMLDVGMDKPYRNIPDKDYLSIRKNEPEQYKYLLGEQAEGAVWEKISKGAQVTPPRGHMVEAVDRFIPFTSETFAPLESLGYGGLGIGWGLQCWEFSNADMVNAGLDVANMPQAYETVSRRIGISATKDAATPYTIGDLKTHQPSARMDRNHKLLYKNYLAHAEKFKRQGFFMGRTPLALLTKDLDGRRAYEYRDMDFYTDHNHSAWRPWMTINTLRKKHNFTYLGSLLVTSFSEHKDYVRVKCLNTAANAEAIFHCRRLILATGALGSARIVLRSLGNDKTRLPILCNPHSYVPCVQPAMFGKGTEPKKLGFGQLSLFVDKRGNDANLSVASTYSYQSLMMFRIIKQLPLDFVNARTIMRYLMPGLIIMITQHPDALSKDKYLRLTKNPKTPTGDTLQGNYELSSNEQQLYRQRDRQYIRAMRKLNAYAVSKVDPGHGSSIHYAGTIPFSSHEKDFRLSPGGRLYGTRQVYVADSSGFTYLPARGLTFSLMANAHLTAEKLLKNE